MPTFNRSRRKLSSYLNEQYPEAKRELKDTEGLQHAFGQALFYQSYLYGDILSRNKSPYRYIEYKDESSHIGDNILHRMMELLENSITYELYGLSFRDLCHLDLTTFEEIEERITKLGIEKDKTINKLMPEIKKGNKNG